jgi:hypothetical protein
MIMEQILSGTMINSNKLLRILQIDLSYKLNKVIEFLLLMHQSVLISYRKLKNIYNKKEYK